MNFQLASRKNAKTGNLRVARCVVVQENIVPDLFWCIFWDGKLQNNVPDSRKMPTCKSTILWPVIKKNLKCTQEKYINVLLADIEEEETCFAHLSQRNNYNRKKNESST